jgi:hypothetical protein
MARTQGGISKGTFNLYTPIDAVTATTTSSAIPIAGAKRITLFLTRANHSAGSTAFTVTVSGDGTTFVGFNKLITNVTNTNAQTPVRVGTVTLSSNTTETVSMDLSTDVFLEMKVVATETTDGTHTAKVLVEY